MTADVILESPERRIILDTKYYRDALARGRGFDTGKLHSDNLYQLLAYLRNRHAMRSGRPTHERHPAVSGGRRAAESRHPPRGVPHLANTSRRVPESARLLMLQGADIISNRWPVAVPPTRYTAVCCARGLLKTRCGYRWSTMPRRGKTATACSSIQRV